MARILLVDDDADQRQLRALILSREGHAVTVAATAMAALLAAQTGGVECVLMDLALPDVEAGLGLIRDLKALDGAVPVVVLSGWTQALAGRPEAGHVAAVLTKPVKTETLLSTLRRVTAFLVVLFAVWVGTAAAQSKIFEFNVVQAGEYIAELQLEAPGANWATPGHEGALAVMTLDGLNVQNLMVFNGVGRYRVFLGELAPGRHTFLVERSQSQSAASAGLEIRGAEFRVAEDYVSHAPVVLARLNTIGKFSDVPLLAYCTRGKDRDGPFLEYTIIFSNEDGGTSTRDLMARWGRVTDIEYIYRVWPDASGVAKKTLIQTREHQDVPYEGPREGRHPVLIPVTDNNMVEPGVGVSSPIRYQLAPVLADLSDGSREKVMDAAPFTYRVSAEELAREAKLRAPGTFDGEKISDPRNYLILEAKVDSWSAAVQFLVKTSKGWHTSANGLAKDHIERAGWVRTAIEMAPGTKVSDITEIGAQCLSLKDVSKQPMPKNGRCLVERFGRIFFLGQDYTPQAPLAPPLAGWPLKAGELRTVPVRR